MANRVPLVKSSRGDIAVLIKPQIQTLTTGDQFFEEQGFCLAQHLGAVLQLLQIHCLVSCSVNGDTGWVAALLLA